MFPDQEPGEIGNFIMFPDQEPGEIGNPPRVGEGSSINLFPKHNCRTMRTLLLATNHGCVVKYVSQQRNGSND